MTPTYLPPESPQRGARAATLGRAAALCAGVLLTASCTSGEPSGLRGPAPGELPVMAHVPQGDAEMGFALGTFRQQQRQGSFDISRAPITVREYKACIDAGACGAPAIATAACKEARPALTEGRTIDVAGGELLPVTCVAPQQAAAYCAWIGGALPTLGEWMVAARGEDVQRFAWGDQPATCEQHTRATSLAPTAQSCCGKGCDPASFYSIGQRPGSDSPFGLTDVLSTPAELLRRSADGQVPACAGKTGSCAVQGNAPGAIDFVATVPEGAAGQDGSGSGVPTYGFRCVTNEVTP